MKKIIYAIGLMVMLQTSLPASATGYDSAARACRKEFFSDLIYCVTAFRALPRNTRLGAIKGCVSDARQEHKLCRDPSNPCINSCETTYNNTVVNCEINNNPGGCSGDANCIAEVTERRTNCVNQAAGVQAACVLTCPAN